jgi:hypothetical protein
VRLRLSPSEAPGIQRYPRYTRAVELELSESIIEQLTERAKSLGIRSEGLARAAVADLVSRPVEEFENAAEYVLEKNTELYRRLG